MGKVISLINTTPDGFSDSIHTTFDDEYYEFWLGLIASVKMIIFGRNTFEIFQNKWPARLKKENPAEWRGKLATALNDIPKVVYSSTLKTTTWNNSSIIKEINAEYINSYKQEGKGGILTVGSPGLLSALTKMKLVNDYYFCIQPLLFDNGGVRLFDKVKLSEPLPLKYVNSKQLKSGMHIIHYQTSI